MLRKEFQSILSLEERAKHFYEHYIEQIDDEKIKAHLASIHKDELRHIDIAKTLIDLVKK